MIVLDIIAVWLMLGFVVWLHARRRPHRDAQIIRTKVGFVVCLPLALVVSLPRLLWGVVTEVVGDAVHTWRHLPGKEK